jgi:hypothetical protein
MDRVVRGPDLGIAHFAISDVLPRVPVAVRGGVGEACRSVETAARVTKEGAWTRTWQG